jgi:hypothetical protein
VDDVIKLRRRRELLALERAEQRLAKKARRSSVAGRPLPEASGIEPLE